MATSMSTRKIIIAFMVYCLVVVPAVLIVLTMCCGLLESLSGSILTYMAALAVGAPGAYLFTLRRKKGDCDVPGPSSDT